MSGDSTEKNTAQNSPTLNFKRKLHFFLGRGLVPSPDPFPVGGVPTFPNPNSRPNEAFWIRLWVSPRIPATFCIAPNCRLVLVQANSAFNHFGVDNE